MGSTKNDHIPPFQTLLKNIQDDFELRFVQKANEADHGKYKPNYYSVFKSLSDCPGMSLTTLAMTRNITQQAMGKICTDMMGDGYLIKTVNEADKRIKDYWLSEQGLEFSPVVEKIDSEIKEDYRGLEKLEEALREFIEKNDISTTQY